MKQHVLMVGGPEHGRLLLVEPTEELSVGGEHYRQQMWYMHGRQFCLYVRRGASPDPEEMATLIDSKRMQPWRS